MMATDDGLGVDTPGQTPLDILLAFATRDVDKTVTVSHPELPALRFVALVPRDGADMAKLAEKAAKREKCTVSDLPIAIINRWQLAACVQRIEINTGSAWEPVEIDGDPVSFLSPELRARLSADGAADCVWRMVKDDGIIRALIAQITEASNFGTEAEKEDPTTAL
jgi:hypothetical protein